MAAVYKETNRGKKICVFSPYFSYWSYKIYNEMTGLKNEQNSFSTSPPPLKRRHLYCDAHVAAENKSIIGLYRDNAIAIESEARDPNGGKVYYVTKQITFHIPEFARNIWTNIDHTRIIHEFSIIGTIARQPLLMADHACSVAWGMTIPLMPPSHRMRGATAVLVRHKPQWHRYDRRSSAVVPSLIAVAPPKTVKTADLRGGTAETFRSTTPVTPKARCHCGACTT